MCKTLITPEPYSMRCGACRSNMAAYRIDQEHGSGITSYRLCRPGAEYLIEHLPDELMPAVQRLVQRHVTDGTEAGKALLEVIGGTATKAAPSLDTIGEMVLAEVRGNSAWAQAFTGKLLAVLDSGEPAPENGVEPAPACVCGKTFEGSSAKANMSRHQAKCKVFQEQKGANEHGEG